MPPADHAVWPVPAIVLLRRKALVVSLDEVLAPTGTVVLVSGDKEPSDPAPKHREQASYPVWLIGITYGIRVSHGTHVWRHSWLSSSVVNARPEK